MLIYPKTKKCLLLKNWKLPNNDINLVVFVSSNDIKLPPLVNAWQIFAVIFNIFYLNLSIDQNLGFSVQFGGIGTLSEHGG
jgi:hypothetical protein